MQYVYNMPADAYKGSLFNDFLHWYYQRLFSLFFSVVLLRIPIAVQPNTGIESF